MIWAWDRWLSWFFFAAGFAFLGLAGYFHFAPPPGFSLEAVETDIEVVDGLLGQKHDVALRVHNHSGGPIRVLGVVEC